jgi:hypothetical protein
MVIVDEAFQAAYRKLEARMQILAEADGDVFLPNPNPLVPVDYVFICMEPSLGRWARSAEDARSKVEHGFQNFLSSIEDFIFHFCIRHYLCKSTQRYHLTDLSKGAMLVKRAGIMRTQRYDNWYPLLVEELSLVATPQARIVAVGNAVVQHLERRAFPKLLTKIIHYSRLAASARAAGVVGQEDSFREFRKSVSQKQIVEMAEELLRANGVGESLRDEILARLVKSQLSESRQKLMFNYKLAFEAIR